MEQLSLLTILDFFLPKCKPGVSVLGALTGSATSHKGFGCLCSRAALIQYSPVIWDHTAVKNAVGEKSCEMPCWSPPLLHGGPGVKLSPWSLGFAWAMLQPCLHPTVLLTEPTCMGWLMAWLELPHHYCYFSMLQLDKGKSRLNNVIE